MRVLLISPLNPKGQIKSSKLRFLNGESTYTEDLLKHPPEGVRYTFYSDALKKGEIVYSIWQKPINWLIKLRIFPLSPQIICFRIKKNFDLIHSLGHGLKIEGQYPPVVLSDSSGNLQMVKGYMGWNDLRIQITYFIKRKLSKILSIYDQELNIKDAKLVVWSNASKTDHIKLGIRENSITVIPPGLAKPTKMRKKSSQNLFNIVFVGTWFKRKGGHILLDAFRQLIKKYQDINLIMVSKLPENIKLPENTDHFEHLSRKEIYKSIYPLGDVFVLVPPEAEGFGLTVLEAASFGIPSIVSSVYALAEVVDDNVNGFVIKQGSVAALISALEKMIKHPEIVETMGKKAQEKFKKKYWVNKTNQKLLKIYLSAAKVN